MFKLIKKIVKHFKSTYRDEYLKLVKESNQKALEYQHKFNMLNDREYNDAFVLKYAKAYVKRMENKK